MRKRLFSILFIVFAFITLSACKAKIYKVTFDTDGGAPVPAVQEVKKGKQAKLPSVEPEKDGYEFVEWQLDGEEYKFTTKVKKDITLVAKWDELPVTDTTLEDAKEALKITFAEGDTIDAVTDDVVLVLKVGEVVVSWASSDEDVVDVDGTVIRADEDKEVTLTATLTYKGETETKTFVLTVLKEIDYAALKTLLIAEYADTFGDYTWLAEEDVELIETIEGSGIVWSSDKVEYFTNAGKVTRPSFSDGDQDIVLTATLDDGTTHTFRFKVKALEQTTEELIDDRLDLLLSGPVFSSGYQEENFTVLETTKFGEDEVDVVWTTSDEDVMNAKGEIQVIYEDTEVTLTAEITYKGVTRSKSKTFLIQAMLNGDSFGELVIGENNGEKIYVRNVALYYEQGTNGYYLVTEKDGILAFVHGKKPATPEEGKLYNIIATVDNYYNSLQIKGVSFIEIEGETPEFEVVYEDLTLEEITDTEIFPQPSASNVYAHDTYKFKDVKIIIDGTGNYNTFLVDKDFDPETDTRTNKNSVMFYYTSQIEELRALKGLVIDEIDVVLEGYRTDYNIWYFSYLLPMEDIKFAELSDIEKVEAAKTNLEINQEFKEEGVLELPTVGLFDTVITWDYAVENDDNNVLIDLGTGDVAIVEGERIIVKIKATISIGEELETKVFDIYIGEPKFMSIAEVYDGVYAEEELVLGLTVKIAGIVTDYFTNGSYAIQDETGAITIRTYNTLELGKKHTIIGKTAEYNGLIQLDSLEIEKVENGLMPNPTPIDEILDDVDELEKLMSSWISIEGATVISVTELSGNFRTIILEKDEMQIELRFDKRALGGVDSEMLAALEEDDIVNYIGVLGWFKGPQLGFGPNAYIGKGWPQADFEFVTTIDFGTEAVTGYAAGEITFTNGDGVSYTVVKDRAQINVSTYAPHNDKEAMLVLAPIKDKDFAFVEFDFGHLSGLNKIEFSYTGWSDLNYDQTKGLVDSVVALEFFDGEEWVALEDSQGEDNLFTYFKKAEYVTVSFEVPGAGKYRIVYKAPSATSTTNTAYALTFDNFIITGEKAPTKPIDPETTFYDLDFSQLTNATTYVTTPTEFTVEGLDLERLNANISESGDHKGVVLGIRSGNNWESPYLVVNEKIEATKVEFVVTNWTKDAQFNLNYADHIYIQTSTDGETWTNVKDFKADWDTESSATNTLTIDDLDGSPIYIRLFVESAGEQEGTYQLRLIVKSLKIWTE